MMVICDGDYRYRLMKALLFLKSQPAIGLECVHLIIMHSACLLVVMVFNDSII